jgi:hypothetical protein
MTKKKSGLFLLTTRYLALKHPVIVKGCLGKTLFIIVIIPYKKLPKNTIYLNYLLFLTDGLNKEIKKYILIRKYNTINESLLKTNLLKCC